MAQIPFSMKYISFLFILLVVNTGFSQEKFTLSGTVNDNSSNETIIGANIIVKDLKQGATTNEYGFYSLTLPKGKHTIIISYLGFKELQKEINLTANTKLNFSLEEEAQMLDEIILSDNRTVTNVKNTEMSVSKLSVKTARKLPAILGEVDILKTLLQLPGVTNAGEGASGFNVRGGGADQNLILLDEAVVYNSSHLFGFFSVFNSDAIKDLKLYKGGIPARYGGRASSVLEIYQKDGNNKEFHGTGGIGLISSRLMLEGPIKKEKGSFLVAGRSSYAHLFLKLADNPNSAYFYDLNTKLTYNINPNNNLYLSGYFGRDVFSINDSFNNVYGNSVFNLRWNHLYSDKLFSNLSMIYSDYYYGLKLDFIGFQWDSGIKNYNIKYDFKHYLSEKIKLSYGTNSIYYDFNPGLLKPINANSPINYNQLDKKFAFEQAFYIESDHKLSEKFSINYGLRYSLFYKLGKEKVYLYNNDSPVDYDSETQVYSEGTPIGITEYGSGKVIDQFNNFEPRLATTYTINEKSSVKLSYNRMTQYLHLISNTSSPTPLDIWTPSSRYLKPQLVDQIAGGYFRNLFNDKYSLEAETYYKIQKNRIDYIDGAELIANNNIEQVILNGQGRAYGLELLFRKNTGKFTGWVAYTISRTEQRTPGRTPNEVGINNGDWYKNVYDKLHNLAISSTYELNKRWTFGLNFIFQTGRPVTFPNGQYNFSPIGNIGTPLSVPSYSSRNKNELPAFHHLDIAATYTPTAKKEKRWSGEWVFSIYNLYNRKNAASITFRQNNDTGNNEAVRLSIFGIVPSVTYNFKF